MIQEVYQKAMKFAGEKHAKQQVPGTNANYLLHISNVAMEVMTAHAADPCFDQELAINIAILHDTIEDTSASWDEINDLFGVAIADGVQALTKDNSLSTKKEKMNDSLDRIQKLSKEVGIVKLADRITNLQMPPEHWDSAKKKLYLQEACIIHEALNHCNQYLSNRLKKKIEDYNDYL